MTDRTATASELARNAGRLLDAVEAGDRIIIERRGRPVARLEPSATTGRSALGSLAGRGRQRVGDHELVAPIADWTAR